MAKVNTVLGAIDANDLGVTLMHEHVLFSDLVIRWNFSDWLPVEAFVAYAKKIIGRARVRGIQTMVDCTAIDSGRDVDLIKRIAEETGMQLIVSTGFYNTSRYLTDKSPDYLAELIIREIEHGIRDTGIRPGVIKCASDNRITKENRLILQATAIAQKATGIPITTHATGGVSLEQLEILEAYGADPAKIIIGHCGDLNDLMYLEQILKKGAFIGMDRFGLDYFNPLEKRIHTLVELYQRGYTDQMVLSHDCSVYIDFLDEAEGLGNMWNIVEQRDPETHVFQYTYIPDVVYPALLEAGLTEADITHLMVDVPRLVFA